MNAEQQAMLVEAVNRVRGGSAAEDGDMAGGAGAVLCQCGPEEFPATWVSAYTLRRSGWPHPVEVLLPGSWSITALQRRLLLSIGVECRDIGLTPADAGTCRPTPAAFVLHALAASPFHTTLYLDSGHVPLRDLSPLLGMLGDDASVHLSCCTTGVDMAPDAQTHESGLDPCVLIVQRCESVDAITAARTVASQSDLGEWRLGNALRLFVQACRLLGARSVPALTEPLIAAEGTVLRIERLGPAVQYHAGHEGRITDFREVNRDWLPGPAREAIGHLAPLRRVLAELGPLDAHLLPLVADRAFEYTREGYDSRRLELRADGGIGEGSAALETQWAIYGDTTDVFLEIYGRDGLTARLVPADATLSVWRGQWVIHECMPVSLVAIRPQSPGSDATP